jgi:hypothetical protein
MNKKTETHENAILRSRKRVLVKQRDVNSYRFRSQLSGTEGRTAVSTSRPARLFSPYSSSDREYGKVLGNRFPWDGITGLDLEVRGKTSSTLFVSYLLKLLILVSGTVAEPIPVPLKKLRSCFKTPHLAPYGVKNRLKMLIYSHVNCASSPVLALSRTHLSNFKTASNRNSASIPFASLICSGTDHLA